MRDIATLESFIDLAPSEESFMNSVLAGLSKVPKDLPCKFFYDERGSKLFERICELEDYYPTRTEIALLETYGHEIARIAGPNRQVVELGSGSSVKIRTLLQHLATPTSYVPIDISKAHLIENAIALAEDFPNLEVNAVCADYSQDFEIPRPRSNPDAKNLGFFPGSTIGNFTPDQASEFLNNVRRLLGSQGEFIIGVDLKKHPALLEAAYDDSEGVTAEFNLNLLHRINRELGADFDLEAFRHLAVYNAPLGRVEMYLESLTEQVVQINGSRIHFRNGETIHTENSVKYTVDEFQDLARAAQFEPVAVWVDENQLFSIHYLQILDAA